MYVNFQMYFNFIRILNYNYIIFYYSLMNLIYVIIIFSIHFISTEIRQFFLLEIINIIC